MEDFAQALLLLVQVLSFHALQSHARNVGICAPTMNNIAGLLGWM